ncbi:hypothetical protein LVJ83_05330 [Uruburuella testudinis]|uniref:Transmembrane protein n=1 Tax=Uruburuella testudinis TaxID=1282863 RepID=A0ABY4DXT5_9NEIS|nr:hypothetical protein [Uruburuella testudinis]UOO82884.1 hypothetical protein LVJ83_05330 [Uruburuella testudinis]
MSHDIIEHQNLPAPENLRTYAMVVYALYLASLVVGITLLVGVIMAYVKRGDMRHTLYYNHMQYLIKTFWYSVLGFFIGGITLALAVGGLILVVVSIWFIYRVVAGFIKLYDGKSVSPEGWL